MATQQPTAAPELFVRLLRETIKERGFSLRELGRRIGASTAYMSRLVEKKRGLPADKTIKKLAKTLEIDEGKLFDAAGRHDAIAAKVFKNPKTRELIRALEPLTEDQFDQVVNKLLETAKKYHPNQS
jgi:transcriptional regulator with XRE-family HTH domain